MNTIQQCKDEVARKHGHIDWNDFLEAKGAYEQEFQETHNGLINAVVDEAMELYASQIKQNKKDINFCSYDKLHSIIHDISYEIEKENISKAKEMLREIDLITHAKIELKGKEIEFPSDEEIQTQAEK